MALDGCLLHIIKEQLNNDAIGARIEKITMPYKDMIIFHLSATGFKCRLLISCEPGAPRIHTTVKKYENPPVPPMMCMLLRKKMVGGRLRGVRQAGIDRVLFLDFDCKNEMSDDVVITVVVEIMGRLSNIAVLQDGKIIDCIRRVDPQEGKRFMLPGAVYELPLCQDKLNILTCDISEITEQLKNGTDITVDKALSKIIDGTSPIIFREIAHKAGVSGLYVSQLTPDMIAALSHQLKKFKSAVLNHGTPTVIIDDTGVPKDFTFIDIAQYGSGYKNVIYSSVGEMLDEFFTERDNAAHMHRLSADLLKLLTNAYERTERKINARKQELQNTRDREKLRIYGELIKANLHFISPGDSFVDAVNYYDPECGTVRIPLDVSLSPQGNAQKYFKEYKKASTAAGMLEELIRKAQEDLVYIDSVYDSLTRATTASELDSIRDELCDTGYAKRTQKSNRKHQKGTPIKYISTDGFVIFAGKNNRMNDELTLKTAAKNDYWLHTKNIPGSHIIIVCNEQTPPNSTLEQAAIIAAVNSKAASSSSVPVECTKARYVKKPSGAKPGMVIYTNNQTFYVNPDREVEKSLKKD